MNQLIFYSSLHYGLPDFYLQHQLAVEESEVDTWAQNILTQERGSNAGWTNHLMWSFVILLFAKYD